MQTIPIKRQNEIPLNAVCWRCTEERDFPLFKQRFGRDPELAWVEKIQGNPRQGTYYIYHLLVGYAEAK